MIRNLKYDFSQMYVAGNVNVNLNCLIEVWDKILSCFRYFSCMDSRK